MKLSTYLFFIIILISSCKRKEEHIVIVGQIYDNEQNIALQNVKVVLSGKKIESGIWSTTFSNLGSAISDAQGNYSIDIENIKVSDFKIDLSKENYFQHIVEYKTDEISKGDNVLNFRLHSKAFIKLFIKNTSPFNNQDLFTYKISNFKNSCFECCTDSSFIFEGENINVNKKCSTYGAYNLIINYSARKNNTIKEYSDTILTIPFDTIFHYINY